LALCEITYNLVPGVSLFDRHLLHFSSAVHIDLRHAETPEPMELFRMWRRELHVVDCGTVDGYTIRSGGESLDRILAVLSKDHLARYKAKAIEDMVGIKRTAVYGKLNSLVRSGQIKKDGNLYYVSD
jgi:hypothetical protein